MQTAIYVSTWHPHIGIGVHEVRQRTVALMVAQLSSRRSCVLLQDKDFHSQHTNK